MFDLKHSLTYIKNDPDWAKKFLIGCLMMFVPTMVSFAFQFLPEHNDKLLMKLLPMICAGLILTLIFTVFLAGYYYKLVNIKVREKSELLPDWKNIGQLVFIGLKSLFGGLLYFAPIVIVTLFILASIKILQGSAAILGLLALLLIIPLCFIGALFFVLMCMSFAYDLKVLSFFNFKRAYLLLKNNVLMYLLYFILCMALSMVVQILSFILGITIIGILAIPFLTFYVSLITADLSAQLINNSELIKSDIQNQEGE